MWSELGLSEEQQTKLKELHEEMRTEKKEHWDKMKGLREQIRTELGKENPGRTTLDNYVARQAELHKAMAGARMDHLLAVKKILTAEQFDKLLDRHWVGCRGGRKGCRHHGKGHRRGGGLPN
jgi:Spy/CpxP family protein refolding chaperone